MFFTYTILCMKNCIIKIIQEQYSENIYMATQNKSIYEKYTVNEWHIV